MNRFKNLNAMPRLLLSFGVLLVLTLGISYLAISNLSQANDRIDAMYQKDFIGALSVKDIAVARAMNGRSVRDALLHINQPAIVSEDEKVSFAQIAIVKSNIEVAERTFYTVKGRELVATMQRLLPDYEKGHHEIYRRVE